MKRAVRNKIAKIFHDERLPILKENVQKILQLLHECYLIHPYLVGDRTVEDFRRHCVQELEEKLSEGKFDILDTYLLTSSYSE